MIEQIDIDNAIKPMELQEAEYRALIDQISQMSPTTTFAEIKAALGQATELPEMMQEDILAKTKERTGKTIRSLKCCIKSQSKKTRSHAELAEMVLGTIGKDNIIFAQSTFWMWSKEGVWRKVESDEIRGSIIDHEKQLNDVMTSSITSSVESFMRALSLRPDHCFNLGDPETVNCLNGELVLVNGDWTLEPHTRENYRTTQIPIKYDPNARAPRFEQFLEEISSGDSDVKEKKQVVLELMGYSLMAHCRYEKFVILVGKGANGKSILLKVVEALCGPKNVAGVQPSQFDRTFQRAHLHNKLVNIVTEIREGEVIADAELKGIVSGETSTVEHKFKPPFEMRPFTTCWFGTNHMPHTRDLSDALFRRAIILTFNKTFKPELGNCDEMLSGKLLAELPGILNLVLNAYASVVVNRKFSIPDSSTKAVKAWHLEADQAAQFVEEYCEPLSGHFVPIKEIYSKYREWGEENGSKQLLTKRKFVERLNRLGYTSTRTATVRLINGLVLIDTASSIYQKQSDGE